MQIGMHLLKRIDEIYDTTQGNGMHHRYSAIITITMFAATQSANQFIHHVIHIHQIHYHIGVIHLNRQIIGNVVTKCSYCAIVIGATPFTKHIWKAIDQNLGSSLLTISKHQLFTRTLRLTVRIIKLCLDRR